MNALMTGTIDAQTLADLLATSQSWTLRERLTVARQVALEIQKLHSEGRTHRALDAYAVTVDNQLRAEVGPPAELPSFGGEECDAEYCPPELAVDIAVELPAEVEIAAAVLREKGLDVDPRRIDIYQFGVLLCRLLTGESILAYRYSTSAKAMVPRAARTLLDRCLGEGQSPPLANCEDLIEVLDDSLGQAKDEPLGAGRETLAAGGAATAAQKLPRDLPFERLGHFEIVRRIGRGGMGDVYKAYDATLDRVVAVKVLPASLARDEVALRRFRVEAAAAAKLAHPNVVPVHFTGEDSGHHFFAMQFIEGESLAQQLARRKRLPWEQAAAIVEQCLAGLAAAHAMNLVHRDVKPGNILLDSRSGQAVLVDFGLVRHVASSAPMTASGAVMGTVAYLAPEQARGQTVDGRGDIYSLGVTFYEMLAGRLPFKADSATGMIFQHAFEAPLPLAEAAPDLPPALVGIVARMMAKDPAGRYPSCAAVLADLKAFRADTSLQTTTGASDAAGAVAPHGLPKPSTKALSSIAAARSFIRRRSKLLLAAAGGAALVLGALMLHRLSAPRAMPSTPDVTAKLAPAPVDPSKENPPSHQPDIGAFDAAHAQDVQKTWAAYLGVPVEVANSVGMKLILIPPGEFTMGSPKEFVEAEAKAHSLDRWYMRYIWGETPAHRVRITKPYRLGATAVTQEEYLRLMGGNPSKYPGDPRRPVETVSYDDATTFCRVLSAMPEERAAHRKYRLPTEAEWEYACRAGSTGRWNFSKSAAPVPPADGEKLLEEYAWFDRNSGGSPRPVAQRRANPWGLYDMYGNVFQWCQDFAMEEYYASSPLEDPAGPPEGMVHACRGGSWFVPALYARSACRFCYSTQGGRDDIGFRVCVVSTDEITPLNSNSSTDSAQRTAASGATSAAP